MISIFHCSSTGRVLGFTLWRWAKRRPFRFGSPFWMTSFPPTVRREGSGNEATQDGDRKWKGRHIAPSPQWGATPHPPPPRSWMTSFPVPPSWVVSSKTASPEMTSVGHADFLEDVLQTSASPVTHLSPKYVL